MTNFNHIYITLITHVNLLINFSHIASRLITRVNLLINFSHIASRLITRVNLLINFSHIASRLITCNHYIKSVYEVTMFVLTKMTFKLVIIDNATFVVYQNGHG